MTKKQKIKALEALKKEFQNGFYDGLCEAVGKLWFYNKTNHQENVYLRELLKEERCIRLAKGLPYSYFWVAYAIAPRTRWINQQIKNLKGE